MPNQFSTTFKDTSGKPLKFWPFIGPHGAWLADGQTTTQPGDPYAFIRKVDARGRNAMDLALAAGTLQIVSTPAQVYTDIGTGTPQVLSVEAGNVLPIDPAWGAGDAADQTTAIVSFVPANGAKSIAATSTIAVNYSAAVTGVTFAVKSGGGAVSGSAASSNGGKTWTFTPGSSLTGGSVVQATISGAVDAANNPVPTVTTAFSVAPQVSSVTPANNATGQATSVHPAVTMNEAVTGLVLTLSQGSTAVAGTVAASSGNTVFTFTPTSALTAGKTYTVSASGGVDAAGNAMAAFTSSFAT